MLRRTFQNFRRFFRTLQALLRRVGIQLRRTFARLRFCCFFNANLSFFKLLRTLSRGSQKRWPQSSQRTFQKAEKFAELLRSISYLILTVFFVLELRLIWMVLVKSQISDCVFFIFFLFRIFPTFSLIFPTIFPPKKYY